MKFAMELGVKCIGLGGNPQLLLRVFAEKQVPQFQLNPFFIEGCATLYYCNYILIKLNYSHCGEQRDI